MKARRNTVHRLAPRETVIDRKVGGPVTSPLRAVGTLVEVEEMLMREATEARQWFRAIGTKNLSEFERGYLAGKIDALVCYLMDVRGRIPEGTPARSDPAQRAAKGDA